MLSPSFLPKPLLPDLSSPPPPTPRNLQAQPPISADPGWREPGIQLLFPKERNPLLRPPREERGVEQPQSSPSPTAGASGPRQPRAGRGEPWRGAQPRRGDYLSFRASRCGPGADVDRPEWQEISQGLPPPRAPGQSAPRGRCSRAAHTHIPGSAPHANGLHPAHAPRPPPPCRPHARPSSGPSPGPGLDRVSWAPDAALSKVKVK